MSAPPPSPSLSLEAGGGNGKVAELPGQPLSPSLSLEARGGNGKVAEQQQTYPPDYTSIEVYFRKLHLTYQCVGTSFLPLMASL